jgi:molybdopterin biosynthesis enzyme MoaB
VIEACEKAGWLVIAYHVCAHDEECIVASLAELADLDEVDAAFTVGGVGLSAHHVTPEATEHACERPLWGFATAMNLHLAEQDATRVLGRATAGMRGRTLVVNLPGDETGALLALAYAAPLVERAHDEVARTPIDAAEPPG